jgi:hypothetical protein
MKKEGRRTVKVGRKREEEAGGGRRKEGGREGAIMKGADPLKYAHEHKTLPVISSCVPGTHPVLHAARGAVVEPQWKSRDVAGDVNVLRSPHGVVAADATVRVDLHSTGSVERRRLSDLPAKVSRNPPISYQINSKRENGRREE